MDIHLEFFSVDVAALSAFFFFPLWLTFAYFTHTRATAPKEIERAHRLRCSFKHFVE